jgi:hypothetical protein
MENWKDINEEEERASKARLVTLFMMIWEGLMPDVMLEFQNTFIIKGANIYFGHKNKVYVSRSYKKEKVTYFNNKKKFTLIKVEKGQKVD